MNYEENKKYIEWLYNYSQTHEYFTDSTSDQNEADKGNLEKLKLLYFVIKDYAQHNFIMPEPDKFGYHYQILYNSNYYKIGITSNEDISYYCRKISLNEDEYVIEFDDILENKPQPQTQLIKLKLEKLSLLSSELKKDNIPINVVIDAIENTYRKTK